jgi:hypothetical protein
MISLFSGLAYAKTKSSQPVINWAVVKQLKPGLSQDQIQKLLGPPKEVTDFSKNPNHTGAKGGMLWEYFENGNTRLSISFPPNAKEVEARTWYLYENDSEKDPKGAMSLFPGASWKSETVKWVNPHHYPNECFFTDNAKGISIEYDRTHEEISSISVWDPARKLASSDDEKPPRFCIENACADGQLSTVVFKDKPLCDLPK